MSLFRSNKVICDFCGVTLHEHEIQCYNSNNYEPMAPFNKYAVQLHAVKVDLCHNCITPISDVFIEEFKKHKGQK
jgi:hypothetical protein